MEFLEVHLEGCNLSLKLAEHKTKSIKILVTFTFIFWHAITFSIIANKTEFLLFLIKIKFIIDSFIFVEIVFLNPY